MVIKIVKLCCRFCCRFVYLFKFVIKYNYKEPKTRLMCNTYG